MKCMPNAYPGGRSKPPPEVAASLPTENVLVFYHVNTGWYWDGAGLQGKKNKPVLLFCMLQMTVCNWESVFSMIRTCPFTL